MDKLGKCISLKNQVYVSYEFLSKILYTSYYKEKNNIRVK